MHSGDFTYWTLKHNNRYIYFNGEDLCYSEYPAFFVRIDYDKEYMGYFEKIDVKSTISKVLSTVTPFMKSIDVDMENISCEPCFEHAELYSDSKKAFELLFNSEYKKEYMFSIKEEEFLNIFEFKFFEY